MKRDEAEKITNKVVEILESIRVEKNVSKSRIQKETGLSRTALTLMANGKNSPTLRTLLMVADAIDADLKEVIQQAQG